jgi:hypothetical protein
MVKPETVRETLDLGSPILNDEAKQNDGHDLLGLMNKNSFLEEQSIKTEEYISQFRFFLHS